MKFQKPTLADLPVIKDIMSQWTEPEEVEKYQKRIKEEIAGKTQYNTQFFVIRDKNKTIGIGGISDPLPKVIKYTKSSKSGAIKILYLDGTQRGKGYGRFLMENLENEARKNGYKDLIIRSAKRYEETAYGFYEKMGYEQVATIDGGTQNKQMAVFYKESL